MGLSEVVMYMPNGKVDWMIFLLAGCDRNSHFVAPKYDGDEESTMCVWIHRNEVLLGQC